MKQLAWQAPEYHHTHKTQDWYWTVGIIAGALVVTCAIFGNFLFAIVLAIGTFTLALFASRPPRVVQTEITAKGVKIDRTLFPYTSLESFGFSASPSGERLFIKSKKLVMPLVSVHIPEELVDDAREALSKKLKEEELSLGFFETLLERLGF